jgi:hypothetical protein
MEFRISARAVLALNTQAVSSINTLYATDTENSGVNDSGRARASRQRPACCYGVHVLSQADRIMDRRELTIYSW